MLIKEKERFLKGIQLVEEELLYPQVEEYAENEEVKKVVTDNTEEYVEYSFIVYLLGSDNSFKGTFEAVSFMDANIQLIRLLKFSFNIITTKIVSDKRYNSFVVYERRRTNFENW